jgi:hypothetical protein
MNYSSLLLYLAVAVCLLVPLSGCGKNVPLSGRVVFSDTNEPLEHGYVSFVQPSFIAKGVIGRDGRYVVGSYKDRDGLPSGTYKVAVYCSKPNPNPKNKGEDIVLIDPKFTDPEHSGLVVEIDASTKTYDIKVDRALHQ